MFIIHALNASEYLREYIKTGLHRDDLENINFPKFLDATIGKLSEEQIGIIRNLAQLNPSNAVDIEIAHNLLKKLNENSKTEKTLLLTAYKTSFELKFLFFPVFDGTEKATPAFSDEVKRLVEQGYNSYKEAFKALAYLPFPDLDFFPRLVNGFTHFCQSYLLIIGSTTKNATYLKEILALLHACLLKYIPMIPPESIGKYYTTPKMIREIALVVAFEKIGENSIEFIKFIDGILTIWYEYFACVRCDNDRRKYANGLLHIKSERSHIDYLINEGETTVTAILEHLEPRLKLPDPVKNSIIDQYYSNLLVETSRLMLVNKFGSIDLTTKLYEVEDIMHIKIIILNEIRNGIMVVIRFKNEMSIGYSSISIQDVNILVQNLKQAFIEDSSECTKLLIDLTKKIIPEKTVKFISEIFKNKPSLKYILLYPDGSLWQVPWQYAINLFPDIYPSTIKRDDISDVPVIIKISSIKCQPNMKTKNLITLAGWKYQDTLEKRIISKRGEIEENLFQNIPAAKEEVIEIEKIWKKSSYKVEMNEDIDAQTILEYVSKPDEPAIVHIACHGSSTERGGPPTLWLPDNKFHKKYSGLHFESFLRVNWTNCEFLFINACFGAFGEARVGGPILGLQEALIINSIPNFLGPLWPVYDDVAESFAKEFYTHLLNSKNYFDAYIKTYKQLLQSVSENKRNTIISYSFYAL